MSMEPNEDSDNDTNAASEECVEHVWGTLEGKKYEEGEWWTTACSYVNKTLTDILSLNRRLDVNLMH